MENKPGEEQTKTPPEITPERVRKELKRVKLEISHDLEECETRYPDTKADGTTLGNIVINT